MALTQLKYCALKLIGLFFCMFFSQNSVFDEILELKSAFTNSPLIWSINKIFTQWVIFFCLKQYQQKLSCISSVWFNLYVYSFKALDNTVFEETSFK